MLKVIVALVAVMVGTLFVSDRARADIIGIEVCADLSASVGPSENVNMFPYIIGAYIAGQTFTPQENFTIGGVKLRIIRDDALPTGTGTIFITSTTSSTNGIVPDFGAGGELLVSESFNYADLIDRDILNSTYVGPLTCDFNDPNGIMVPFSNVENLYADVTYAITVIGSGSEVGTAIGTAEFTGYPFGNAVTLELGFDDPTDPEDWVILSPANDFEFVLYEATTIDPFVTPGGLTSDVDDWFDDWLLLIGATDIGSQSFIIALLALGIFLSVVFFKGVAIIGAVLGFMFITSMAILEYLSIGIAMTGILLVSFAALVGLVVLRRNGGE